MKKNQKGKAVRKLSPEEKQAIRKLKELAKNWPDTLWLNSMSGILYVMQRDVEGRRAYTLAGYCDPEYIVTRIDIPNDGGDW